ncbi:hypothetical protein [Roseomonas chloroacetimidivorans]|uniref:hypothetical protein n=1 Tax=Roseomonas chloroacetimidivorans TaxID=1766656 RepID=UPI003C72CF3A
MKTTDQGSSYEWRIIRFSALGEAFRVLVLLNDIKEIFRATLAHEVGDIVRIICVREFHAKEPGWHCHAAIKAGQGVTDWKHRELRKHPLRPDYSAEFGVTGQESATAVALRFYRIEERGGLL